MSSSAESLAGTVAGSLAGTVAGFAVRVASDPVTSGSIPPGAVPDGETVRDAADQILSRPEFVEQQPSLLERFFEWLGRQLGRLPLNETPTPAPGTTAGGGRGGSGVLTVVLVIAGIVVLLLVARWVRRNGPAGRRRRERLDDEVVVEDRRPLGEDELAAMAAQHEAAGEWSEAVRARYRWAVAVLRRQGAVPAEPGRTSGELRREVAATAPSTGPAFDALTDTFERAWYAGRVAGPEDGAAARALADEVATAAVRPAPGTPEDAP